MNDSQHEQLGADELEDVITSIELEILEHYFEEAKAEYEETLHDPSVSKEQKELAQYFMLEAQDRLERLQNAAARHQTIPSHEDALHAIETKELRLINDYEVFEPDWDTELDIDQMNAIDIDFGDDGLER